MAKVKHFAVGVAMTALTLVVLFYITRNYAPASVRQAFQA